MKKKFTFLIAALMLLAMITQSITSFAQSDKSTTYTSNVSISSDCKVVISNTEYDGKKLGSSGNGGSGTFTAPKGTKYIHLHVAAWNGKSPSFSYKVGNGSEQSISDITSNSGIASSTPFTWQGTDQNANNKTPNSSYHYKVITLSSELEAATTITFKSTSERVVYWGVNTEGEVYTITPIVNDGDMGSVAVNGTTITATPNSGFRVIAGDGGYTVTLGNATVVNNGDNTFTVTPTSNCTVRINFEAIPTHKASFSVNSVIDPADDKVVAEGSAITFPSDPVAISGKEFVGWKKGSGINEVTNVAPTMYDEDNMGDADVTYYAVFASSASATVTKTDTLTLSTTGVTGSSYSAWTGKTASNTSHSAAVYSGCNAGSNSSIQLNATSGTSYRGIISTTSGGKLKKVTVKWNSNTSKGRSVTVYGKNKAYTTMSAFNSNKGTSLGTITKDTSTELTITCDSTYIGFYATQAIYIDKIAIDWETTGTVYSYCTTVIPVNGDDIMTGDVTIPENTIVSVTDLEIPSANNNILTVFGVLEVTGSFINTNEAHLIIKDGGQLKFTSTLTKTDVKATVEKAITGYGEGNDKWYFIASPLESSFTLDGSDMVDGTYDLYRLNNTTWENYENDEHADFTTLNNGYGYLYANDNDIILSFAGTIKPFTTANGANTKHINEGWNLIGNPYTFDIYINKPYYKMNDEGSDVVLVEDYYDDDNFIPAGTGVVVKSDEEGGEDITFTKTAPEEQSTGNNGNITMTLARTNMRGNAVQDKAVVSFNENMQLGKFVFNENNSKLYIPKNGEDYAIAFSDRQGDMDLNFKASELGTYTISFEGVDMDLNGVYLIDILEQKEIDLSVNPSYTFMGSPADREARFKIVFRTTGFENSPSDIFAYQNGNEIVVSGEGELQVFDVTGRKVMTATINGVQTVNGLANGVYIFRMNEKVQKIVVR